LARLLRQSEAKDPPGIDCFLPPKDCHPERSEGSAV